MIASHHVYSCQNIWVLQLPNTNLYGIASPNTSSIRSLVVISGVNTPLSFRLNPPLATGFVRLVVIEMCILASWSQKRCLLDEVVCCIDGLSAALLIELGPDSVHVGLIIILWVSEHILHMNVSALAKSSFVRFAVSISPKSLWCEVTKRSEPLRACNRVNSVQQ